MVYNNSDTLGVQNGIKSWNRLCEQTNALHLIISIHESLSAPEQILWISQDSKDCLQRKQNTQTPFDRKR